MCTLTFVQTPNGFTITANRDESPARNANGISAYTTASGEDYYIAREPLHGGTNLAVGANGRVVVLLNGAFKPHDFGGTYRRSRGLMVLDFLEFTDASSFTQVYDFEGIEPFTLVAIEDEIQEIRWDGTSLYSQVYSRNEPRIWASAQLYSSEVRQKRDVWFTDLLADMAGTFNPDRIFDFHLNGGDGDLENDMVMNRFDMVKTVSVSQLYSQDSNRTLRHIDLLTGVETKKVL